MLIKINPILNETYQCTLIDYTCRSGRYREAVETLDNDTDTISWTFGEIFWYVVVVQSTTNKRTLIKQHF